MPQSTVRLNKGKQFCNKKVLDIPSNFSKSTQYFLFCILTLVHLLFGPLVNVL